MSRRRADPREASEQAGDSGGIEFWAWVCEAYLHEEIEARSDGKRPISGAGVGQVQVIFRFDRPPEVRFGEEVIGRELVEGRVELAAFDDVHGPDRVENAYGFELPSQDSEAGHITAISRGSGMDMTICGAAKAQSIEAELDGADEFIASAESALDGPMGPFANVAFPAARCLRGPSCCVSRIRRSAR